MHTPPAATCLWPRPNMIHVCGVASPGCLNVTLGCINHPPYFNLREGGARRRTSLLDK